MKNLRRRISHLSILPRIPVSPDRGSFTECLWRAIGGRVSSCLALALRSWIPWVKTSLHASRFKYTDRIPRTHEVFEGKQVGGVSFNRKCTGANASAVMAILKARAH
ncbi:hypothetical protein VNO77_04529 [Canavalia gladiata]|uniref:Uncharacterized protein n=1 Tax=Canavalia gladiata TaxID=3824 RepID=A0AAN9RDA3_CANGL